MQFTAAICLCCVFCTGGCCSRRSSSLHRYSQLRTVLEHNPLLLFAYVVSPVQVADAAVVAAARIATALFITANALVLLPGADTPIGRLSVLAAAVILLSPVAASTAEFARNFRLNETLMKACKDTSVLLAGPLLVMMALAVGGLRLLPVQLPGPAQRLEVEWLAGLGAVVDSGRWQSTLPFCCCLSPSCSSFWSCRQLCHADDTVAVLVYISLNHA